MPHRTCSTATLFTVASASMGCLGASKPAVRIRRSQDAHTTCMDVHCDCHYVLVLLKGVCVSKACAVRWWSEQRIPTQQRIIPMFSLVLGVYTHPYRCTISSLIAQSGLSQTQLQGRHQQAASCTCLAALHIPVRPIPTLFKLQLAWVVALCLLVGAARNIAIFTLWRLNLHPVSTTSPVLLSEAVLVISGNG